MYTRATPGDLAAGWTQVAKLTAGDGAASDYFGNSVSIDGDTMVIAAHSDDDDVKGDNSGSAYVFTRDHSRRPRLRLDAGRQTDRGRRRCR